MAGMQRRGGLDAVLVALCLVLLPACVPAMDTYSADTLSRASSGSGSPLRRQSSLPDLSSSSGSGRRPTLQRGHSASDVRVRDNRPPTRDPPLPPTPQQQEQNPSADDTKPRPQLKRNQAFRGASDAIVLARAEKAAEEEVQQCELQRRPAGALHGGRRRRPDGSEIPLSAKARAHYSRVQAQEARARLDDAYQTLRIPKQKVRASLRPALFHRPENPQDDSEKKKQEKERDKEPEDDKGKDRDDEDDGDKAEAQEQYKDLFARGEPPEKELRNLARLVAEAAVTEKRFLALLTVSRKFKEKLYKFEKLIPVVLREKSLWHKQKTEDRPMWNPAGSTAMALINQFLDSMTALEPEVQQYLDSLHPLYDTPVFVLGLFPEPKPDVVPPKRTPEERKKALKAALDKLQESITLYDRVTVKFLSANHEKWTQVVKLSSELMTLFDACDKDLAVVAAYFVEVADELKEPGSTAIFTLNSIAAQGFQRIMRYDMLTDTCLGAVDPLADKPQPLSPFFPPEFVLELKETYAKIREIAADVDAAAKQLGSSSSAPDEVSPGESAANKREYDEDAARARAAFVRDALREAGLSGAPVRKPKQDKKRESRKSSRLSSTVVSEKKEDVKQRNEENDKPPNKANKAPGTQ